MAGIFSIPDEVLVLLLGHLDGHDSRSFGNTCKRLRNFILTNKLVLPKPVLKWDTAQLTFCGKITLSRRLNFISLFKRKRVANTNELEKWEFTEEEFSAEFADLFFVIAPREIYIKCEDFNISVELLVRKCVGNLRGCNLALEMDKCSLNERALKDFFKHYSPFGLQLTGHFDRSIVSDQILPVSSLFALYIGADTGTCSRISGITVRRIVNNWSQRYPDNCKDRQDLPPIDNYLLRHFTIEIPGCDLDYNEFFSFFKELIRVPHCTKERIMIGNLPKGLIHTIYNNLSTFNEVGPAVWVEEGICNVEDIRWSGSLSCQCDKNHSSGHLVAHNYFIGWNRAPDPSQMCDTVRLDLSITVLQYKEVLQMKRCLLNVWITLRADNAEQEKCSPETALVKSTTSRKHRRTTEL
ncbi:hypothetical protein V3C99_014144 [Haemonchus contortus]